MNIGIGEYSAFATVLFSIGAVGFLLRRSFLIQLMSIELMLNSVNVLLIGFNRVHTHNHDGQVFAFFVIAVAAAEAAVGLAIAIAYFRLNKTVETDRSDLLRH